MLSMLLMSFGPPIRKFAVREFWYTRRTAYGSGLSAFSDFGSVLSQLGAGQRCRSTNTLKREKSWWASASAFLPVSGAILTCVQFLWQFTAGLSPHNKPSEMCPLRTSLPLLSPSERLLESPLKSTIGISILVQSLMLGGTRTKTRTPLKMFGKTRSLSQGK